MPDEDRYLARQEAVHAALEAIERGEWDLYLLKLRAAIQERRDSDGYRAFIQGGKVAGTF